MKPSKTCFNKCVRYFGDNIANLDADLNIHFDAEYTKVPTPSG